MNTLLIPHPEIYYKENPNHFLSTDSFVKIPRKMFNRNPIENKNISH